MNLDFIDNLPEEIRAKLLKPSVEAVDEKTVDYYFLVDGLAPELLRDGAFRRVKHYDTRGLRAIKCPYCGGEFDFVDKTVNIEVFRYSQKLNITANNNSTCRRCYGKVYIIHKSA